MSQYASNFLWEIAASQAPRNDMLDLKGLKIKYE